MGRRAWVWCVAALMGTLAMESAWAVVPSGPSDVYVQGTQLMVRRRKADGTLDAARPYAIRGVTWSAATRAPATGPNPSDLSGTNPFPNTIQYGFFFDWPFRDTAEGQQGHVVLGFWMNRELSTRAAADLPIIAQLHANTVRLYSDMGDDVAGALQLLDQAYEQGLMVILTVAGSKADFDAGRHLQAVDRYKNHPAVLLWMLGNEWNFNKYFGYSIPQASAATEAAAQAIKLRDPNHPVASSLGDRFSDAQTCTPGVDPCCGAVDPDSDIPAIVAAAPSVDLWGLNIYRGASFGMLFDQWQAATAKPMFLSEFGTDSFATTGYQQPFACSPADNVVGFEDQPGQANHDAGLWLEIQARLSSVNPSEQAAGGLIHEFNDELWKVGSFHLGLGNLVDYDGPDNLPNTADDDSSYDEYNQEGYILPGAHPDGVANEERFGLVTAERAPKQAFGVIQDLFAELSTPVLSPIGPKTVNEGQLLSFTISATDLDGDPITYSATPLPAGATLDAATGAFAWTPSYSQAGNYSVTFTASDGALTDQEMVAITVANVPVPDLILTAVTPGASTVNAGSTLSVTTTVRNQGAAAAGSFAVAFRLSKNQLYGDADDVASTSTRSVSSLAINTSSTAATSVVVSSSTPAGTYYVCAQADSAGVVAETNNANNALCSTAQVTVPPPDLVVTALSTTTTAVAPGKSFTLSNTEKNQGGSRALSFAVAFHLSKDALYGGTNDAAFSSTRSISSLNAGASTTGSTSLSVPSTTALGSYYVCAMVDSGLTVVESVETNNTRCTSAAITVTRPDLVMSALSGPASGTRGSAISIASTVMNSGLVSSGGSMYTGLYLSSDAAITTADRRIGSVSVVTINAGASASSTTTLTLSTTLTPGTYYLGAIADYTNKVVELSETNNSRAGNQILVQ